MTYVQQISATGHREAKAAVVPIQVSKPKCFVMQRFDEGGPHDVRYKNILAPATRDAGAEPYRVDEDPKVIIPIDDIVAGIRTSPTVLVDISANRANVWIELGIALGIDKNPVIICQKKRENRLPFDIKHRHVVFYDDSTSVGAMALRTDVTARIKARLAQAEIKPIEFDLKSELGPEPLTKVEAALIGAIVHHERGTTQGAWASAVSGLLLQRGFSEIEIKIAVRSLHTHQWIDVEEFSDNDGANVLYHLKQSSLAWMLTNRAVVAEALKSEDW